MRRYTPILSLILLLSGCAYLEPGVYDPALEDRKLSLHVLESQSREAQRMIADLRREMEAGRQTLAASQVARAQMQGQLREAERRYDEARQIIDLQREELARLRDEREEVLRAGSGIRTELKRLQRQIAALTGSRAAPRGRPGPAHKREASDPAAVGAGTGLTAQPVVDGEPGTGSLHGTGPDGAFAVNRDLPEVVVVRPGDTLWRIARRHQVSYPALRSLNGLDENPDLILVGQELLLPE